MNKEGNNYISKFHEWLKHQFNPGYYTGGRTSQSYHYPGRPLLTGFLMMLGGVIFSIIYVMLMIFTFDSEEIIGMIISGGFFLGISILLFSAGMRIFLKSHKNKRKQFINRIFKKWVRVTIIIMIIVLSLLIVYKLNEQKSIVYINASSDYIVRGNDSNEYIYLKDYDIKIKCTEQQSLYMYRLDEKDFENSVRYKIIYRFNTFHKKRGRVIEIVKETY